MQNIEFTSNELYFLLNYLRKINEQVNNKYSNSVFTKIETAFLNQYEVKNQKEVEFKREYECEWVGDKYEYSSFSKK